MEKFEWYKLKLEYWKEVFYGEGNNWFYFENNDTSGNLLRVKNAHIIEALNEEIRFKFPVLILPIK